MSQQFTPGEAEPGRCQVCGEFRLIRQYWPVTLPARFVEACGDCVNLGDEEIARRLPPHRRDGAVV